MDNKELVERRNMKEAAESQRIIPQVKGRYLQQLGENTAEEQQQISSLIEVSPIEVVDSVMDDVLDKAMVHGVPDRAVHEAEVVEGEDAVDEAAVETQDSRLERLSRSCPYCEKGTNSWCKYNLTFYNHMLVDEVHKVRFIFGSWSLLVPSFLGYIPTLFSGFICSLKQRIHQRLFQLKPSAKAIQQGSCFTS